MSLEKRKIESVYSPKDEFEKYISNIESEQTKLYITNRVLKQIDWYDQKSKKNEIYYKRCMIASIILNSLIPIFILLVNSAYGLTFKIIVIAISSSTTAISAIIALYNFRELWVQYRSNCESLKSVLHRFFAKSGEFNGDDSKSFEILVMSSEQYITKEYKSWISLNMPYGNDKQNKDN